MSSWFLQHTPLDYPCRESHTPLLSACFYSGDCSSYLMPFVCAFPVLTQVVLWFLSGGANQSSATGQWCPHTTAGTGLLGRTSDSGSCHSLVPQQLQVRCAHSGGHLINKWYLLLGSLSDVCILCSCAHSCTLNIGPYNVFHSHSCYFASCRRHAYYNVLYVRPCGRNVLQLVVD